MHDNVPPCPDLDRILRAAIARERGAFDELSDALERRVAPAVLKKRRAGRDTSPRELAQETLISVFRMRSDSFVPGRGTAFSFLFSIATRRLADLRRRNGGETLFVSLEGSEGAERGPARGRYNHRTLSQAEHALADARMTAEKVLGEASPEVARALQLHYLHGLDRTEVARALKTTPRSTWRHVDKFIRRMRNRAA